MAILNNYGIDPQKGIQNNNDYLEPVSGRDNVNFKHKNPNEFYWGNNPNFDHSKLDYGNIMGSLITQGNDGKYFYQPLVKTDPSVLYAAKISGGAHGVDLETKKGTTNLFSFNSPTIGSGNGIDILKRNIENSNAYNSKEYFKGGRISEDKKELTPQQYQMLIDNGSIKNDGFYNFNIRGEQTKGQVFFHSPTDMYKAQLPTQAKSYK